MSLVQIQNMLAELGNSTITYFPYIVGALLLLILGYIVGKIFGVVIKKFCEGMKVDKYIKSKGFKLSHLFKMAGEWMVYLAFISAAIEYLSIPVLPMFINSLLVFVSNAIVAAIIMVAGCLLGGFLEEQVTKTKGTYAGLVGKIVNFFTVYMAISLALPVLGINTVLINNILLIIVASLGLGFAIAVGLGLKDSVSKEADKYVDTVKEVISKVFRP